MALVRFYKIQCDKNYLKWPPRPQKSYLMCKLFCFLCRVHVFSDVSRKEELMTFTAVHQQGMMVTFWLYDKEGRVFCICTYNICKNCVSLRLKPTAYWLRMASCKDHSRFSCLLMKFGLYIFFRVCVWNNTTTTQNAKLEHISALWRLNTQ